MNKIVGNTYSLFVYFLCFMFFSACGQETFDEKMKSMYQYTVPLIKSSELAKTDFKGYYILDTREKKEYEVSHLPDAMLVGYDHFDIEKVRKIPRDAQVIVYCSVGYRSERIGEKLKKAGFVNVKNLYGGIFDWKNKGQEVLNKQNKPTDSVHTYNAQWAKWLCNGIKVYE